MGGGVPMRRTQRIHTDTLHKTYHTNTYTDRHTHAQTHPFGVTVCATPPHLTADGIDVVVTTWLGWEGVGRGIVCVLRGLLVGPLYRQWVALRGRYRYCTCAGGEGGAGREARAWEINTQYGCTRHREQRHGAATSWSATAAQGQDRLSGH